MIKASCPRIPPGVDIECVYMCNFVVGSFFSFDGFLRINSVFTAFLHRTMNSSIRNHLAKLSFLFFCHFVVFLLSFFVLALFSGHAVSLL